MCMQKEFTGNKKGKRNQEQDQIMGCHRIEIKKIDEKPKRQTTFTKRRQGLFSKADDLVELCGAEVAVIIFSEANTPFPHPRPAIDSTVNRYLERTADAEAEAEVPRREGGGRRREIGEKYEKTVARLAAEKKRGEIVDKALAVVEGPPPMRVEAFGLEEAEQLGAMVEEMVQRVAAKDNERTNNAASNDVPVCDPLSLCLGTGKADEIMNDSAAKDPLVSYSLSLCLNTATANENERERVNNPASNDVPVSDSLSLCLNTSKANERMNNSASNDLPDSLSLSLSLNIFRN